MDVVCWYNGEQVLVPKEVAEFLKHDRRRARAEAKRDERHLSKGLLERVLSPQWTPSRPVEDQAEKNLRFENLRNIVAELSEKERELIHLRYDENLSLEAIAKAFRVSKMAVCKRLKKVHEQLRGLVL